jgi:hypothetical protein
MLRLLAAIASSFTACTVVSACAIQCGANPQKLASLQRGMTYEETSSIMGCPGQLVAGQSPASGDYATVEWNGPESIFFKRTRIDFLDGKLLYYTTENRGGL